ncbi:MAG: hypothetical protein ACLSWL_06540 [Ruminococcus sp.]
MKKVSPEKKSEDSINIIFLLYPNVTGINVNATKCINSKTPFFCPSSMNIEMLAVMITTSSDRIKYSLYFVITKIFEVK